MCLKGYDLGRPRKRHRHRCRGSRAVVIEELDNDGGEQGDDESDSEDGALLLQAAFGSSSDSSDEPGGDDGHAGWRHGVMPVTEAQRTRAVRVSSVFTSKEIQQLLAVHRRLRGICGLEHKKHGEGAQNWETTFLHSDGHFARELPTLRQKILRAAAAVDEAQVRRQYSH